MTEAKRQWAYLDGINKLQIYNKDCVNMMSKMENIDDETKLLFSEHVNIHNKNFNNKVGY